MMYRHYPPRLLNLALIALICTVVGAFVEHNYSLIPYSVATGIMLVFMLQALANLKDELDVLAEWKEKMDPSDPTQPKPIRPFVFPSKTDSS